MSKQALCLIVALVTGLAAAAPDAVSRYQLSLEKQQALNQTVRAGLKQARAQESALEKRLRQQETEMSQRMAAVYDAEIALVQTQAKQAELANGLLVLQQDMRLQRTILAEQVRFAYLSGSTELAPGIFAAKQEANRITAWYRYLLAKREQTLQMLTRQAAKQQQLQAAVQQEARTLSAKRTAKEQAEQQLQGSIRKNAQKLAALKTQIHTDNARLVIGEKEAKALEQMLARLNAAGKKTTMVPVDVTPFTNHKGRLPLPVAGARMSRLPRQKAVVLKAAQGSEVQAIADGRVVFADWLRGFGLLVIVDHGGGYMSLYGRNQTVFKSRGEWVRAGETLGKVGETGGLAGSGLFFELRHHGTPLALRSWLKRG